MGYYLGLVGAARVSQAAIASDDGTIIAHISAPPLTMRVNTEISLHLLQTLERLAVVSAIPIKALVKNLKCACISMSGVYTEIDRAILRQILSGIGFTGSFDIIICEDAHAHLAANFLACGGVIIASTGSNVFLRGHGMQEPIRVDGWGSVIGDEGGGYELGIQCLRALLKGVDGRLKHSEVLENKVVNYIGLSSVKDIIPWYYGVRQTVKWRSDISDLCIPLISAAEEEKDSLAKEVIQKEASHLLDSLKVAIQKTELPENKDKFAPLPIKLILEGGLFRHSQLYRDAFISWFSSPRKNVTSWQNVWPEYQPVVGAVALAMSNNCYIEGDDKRFEELRKSSQDDLKNKFICASVES